MANPVKAYAWGSRDGIAAVQGRPPSEAPEAELWMGAHPQASSVLEGVDELGGRLDALIAAHPEQFLGARVAARFGPRLPFLVKLLSAAEPLSLQVHPDDALARAGFDDEEAAGLDPAAAHRVYGDPHGKPEMLMAITDFELLLGFRPATEAAGTLACLAVPALDTVIDGLRSGRPTGEAFLSLLEWPDADRADLVSKVRAADANSPEPAATWVCRLAEQYPSDPGVVGALLLNHMRLQPGQAVVVSPGQIHAYLHGTGVELLGSSDNVVRGGLTPKHVSLHQLRRLLALDAARAAVVEPAARPGGGEFWPTLFPEFSLSRIGLGDAPQSLTAGLPAIVLVVEGKAEVTQAGVSVSLGPGESAFVSAEGPSGATVAGSGVALVATPGAFSSRGEA